MPDDNDLYWNDPDDSYDAYDDAPYDAQSDADHEYEVYDADEDYTAPDDAPVFVDDDPGMDDGRDDDFFEVRTFDVSTDDAGLYTTADDAGGKPARPRAPIPAHAAAPAFSVPLQRAPEYTARRAVTRAKKPPPAWWVTLRTLLIVLVAAVLVSTVFSLWTRPDFFTDEFRAGLNQVQATQRVVNIQPSPLPTESRVVRIGIVAGHSGLPEDESFESDPGAVCPDGLTELSINQAVAREVVAGLRRLEYEVDLLDEFDEQLEGYQADVLVSIHTNDCQDYGAAGTGYNAASASARQTTRGEDEFLLECLIDRYGKTTGLPRHEGITYDMTGYHTFNEVSADTPTAIIELGFMNRDRLILTTQQPLVAQGIINGILCFLEPEDVTQS